VKASRGRLRYDAVRGELVDVRASGILDSVNVLRAALRCSVSAAVMLLLSEALVIPKHRYLHASPTP
jgi:chaperonin GroEL (HSP60 family)